MGQQHRSQPRSSDKPVPPELNGYRIRESRRAKNVSIKVSTWGDVEVVVPPGFSVTQLTHILKEREGWIQKAKARIQAERRTTAHETTATLPTEIVLRAIAETWTVAYHPTDDPNVTLNVGIHQHHLTLTGHTEQTALCHQVLGRWLRDYARYRLAPWLNAVSAQVQLPYNRLAIRRQKTRWASCSSKHNINLNDKLLFIPPELVHYVLVHELCHTIHLNHSSQFWALVKQKEPNCQRLDQELRTAWRYVPRWLD